MALRYTCNVYKKTNIQWTLVGNYHYIWDEFLLISLLERDVTYYFFFYIARFSTFSFSSMWFSSCSCRLCRSSASFLKKQHRFLFLYYAEKHTISTIIHLRIFVRSWLEHALRTQAIVRPAFASRLSRLLSLYVFLQMLRVWGFTWPKINKKTW